MEELQFKPAHQLAALIRERQVSAVDVLETHLAQIGRHNGALNAIVSIDEEGACQRAWEADDALAHGHCWGPLHGVPFTLKDHQDTVGLRSTMGGYPPFLDRLPNEDSAVASRLKAAGAILLGKSNAVFYPFGTFGHSKNPWDLARCPGVSSSGAAAALAAGLTPLDVGTDTNGSVLFPAHNCGIFGLRPTQHRVPLTGLTTLGPAQPFRSLTVFGPMARAVADIKLVLKIIAGPDGRDFYVPPVPWREFFPPALSELRVAWTPTFPGAQVGREIRKAIEILVARLEDAGAKTGRRRPPVDFVRQAEIGRLLMNHVMLSFLCLPVNQEMAGGDQPSLADYLQLLKERERLIDTWEQFFSDWDVLLCPVCGATAQLHGDETTTVDGNEVSKEAVSLPLRLAAVTGNPSLVIPLGQDAAGLPIGAQLICARWQDERLLAMGALISEFTEGFCRPPGF